MNINNEVIRVSRYQTNHPQPLPILVYIALSIALCALFCFAQHQINVIESFRNKGNEAEYEMLIGLSISGKVGLPLHRGGG